MPYLEHRCPNRPYADRPLQECRSEMAGPSLDTIRAHDFKQGPFEDLRYCPKCHCMIKVTIVDSETNLPSYELVPENEVVDFVQPWLSEMIGRKIKNRGNKCLQVK